MTTHSLLIFCTHGTYGRDDDTYGALLLANTALAKGTSVTLLLLEDGVLMSKKNQNTSKIGLPNNLTELQDFIDLGGTLRIEQTSLDERGINPSELIHPHILTPPSKIPDLIALHTLSLTF